MARGKEAAAERRERLTFVVVIAQHLPVILCVASSRKGVDGKGRTGRGQCRRARETGDVDALNAPRLSVRVVLPVELGEAVLVLEASELLLERDSIGRAGKRRGKRRESVG
jgi:hypothetical protein